MDEDHRTILHYAARSGNLEAEPVSGGEGRNGYYCR